MATFLDPDVLDLEALAELVKDLAPVPRFDMLLGHPETLEPMLEAAADCNLDVHSSTMITRRRQTRFPRSKRRRMRKKWSKDSRNFVTEPSPGVYMLNTEPVFTIPPMALDTAGPDGPIFSWGQRWPVVRESSLIVCV